MQTLEPLASTRGIAIEPAEELGEERQEADGLAFLRSLAGTDAIVCTHGGSPWAELAGRRRTRRARALVLDAEGAPLDALAAAGLTASRSPR